MNNCVLLLNTYARSLSEFSPSTCPSALPLSSRFDLNVVFWMNCGQWLGMSLDSGLGWGDYTESSSHITIIGMIC